MIRFGRLTTAFAVSALLCSSTAVAQEGAPFLFEIEGEKPSYLFGTFNPPFKETSKLPDVVAEKLGGVDEILEETKQDQEAVQKYLYLEDGQTLKDVLPEEVYAAVEKRLSSKGIPIAQLARFRPWLVGMQLTQLEFMAELQAQVGQGAALQKIVGTKPKDGLLSFEEAAGAYAMGEMADQVQIVKDILVKLGEWDEAGVKPNSEWVKTYVAGDLEACHEAWVKDMTGGSEDLNTRLVKATYDTYVDLLSTRIVEKLKAGDKSYGITVGCNLFGGPNSLIKALEAKGLKIKRIGG